MPGGRPLLVVSALAVVAALALIVALSGALSGGSVDLRQPSASTPPELADGMALGGKDAPLTMEVWSDFQCPACGVFARQTEPALITDYVQPGKLRIVYRDFAFLGAESKDAAAAARCAGEQGRFWPYHDYVFANQRGENLGAFDRRHLDAFARAAGLDTSAFAACYDSARTRSAVLDETGRGTTAGVTSTPTLVVNGHTYPSGLAYDQLRQLLDAALGPGGPSPSPAPSAS